MQILTPSFMVDVNTNKCFYQFHISNKKNLATPASLRVASVARILLSKIVNVSDYIFVLF